MREHLSTIAFVVVLVIVFTSFGIFLKSSYDCNQAGGEMVKTMYGTYKCVTLKEINP